MASSYKKIVRALSGSNKDNGKQPEKQTANQADTGLAFGAVESYTLLPVNLRREYLENSTPYWRIELHDMANTPPAGYDLVGAVVVGRGEEADLSIDVGYLEGLSRQHLMLRPTADTLYIIDLDSKNGTCINDKTLSSGSEYPVADGDLITVGNMSFSIKLIDHSTIGELRDRIYKISLTDADQSEQAKPKAAAKDHPNGKEAPETIIMHFRRTMRYPESISRWMSDRRDQKS